MAGDAFLGAIEAWLSQQSLPPRPDCAQICAAVSGGADSMALALALSRILGPRQVITVTVDHGLRLGSAAEARWTQKQLHGHGLDARLVTLAEDDFQLGNLQAAARNARYRAIATVCDQEGVDVVATGHTLDDQAETLLARLARASGTKGLSAMTDRAHYPVPGVKPNLTLIRPLLGLRRTDCVQFLQKSGQRWAEDPSNRSDRFDRVRLRTALKQWEAQGFEAQRIAATAKNMQRAEEALEVFTDRAWQDCVHSMDGNVIVKLEVLQGYPEDIQLRLLSRIIWHLSGRKRAPRLAALQRLLGSFSRHHDMPGQTLGGVKFSVTSSRLMCEAE